MILRTAVCQLDYRMSHHQEADTCVFRYRRRYVQPGPPVQQLGPTPPGGLPAANPGATAVNAAIIAAAQAAADSLAGKVRWLLIVRHLCCSCLRLHVTALFSSCRAIVHMQRPRADALQILCLLGNCRVRPSDATTCASSGLLVCGHMHTLGASSDWARASRSLAAPWAAPPRVRAPWRPAWHQLSRWRRG